MIPSPEHDISPTSAANDSLDGLEDRRMAALERLKQIETEAVEVATKLATIQEQLQDQFVSGVVKLRLRTQDLADALEATDLASLRRSWWKRLVRDQEKRSGKAIRPGSGLDWIADFEGESVEPKSRASDRMTGTVLQYRGASLRVASGDETLRCWIDVPLQLADGDVPYWSKPFRVVTANLYRFLFSSGVGVAAQSLGDVFSPLYDPGQRTITFAFEQGPIALRTVRLKDTAAFDATPDPADAGIRFDPRALGRALGAVFPSVSKNELGPVYPFAEIRSGCAIGHSYASTSICEGSALGGLDLTVDQHNIETLSCLLSWLDPETTVVRLTDTHALIADGTITLALPNLPDRAIGGLRPQIKRWQSRSGFDVSLNGPQLFEHLRVARILSDPRDSLTRVNLEFRSIKNTTDESFAEQMARTVRRDLSAGPDDPVDQEGVERSQLHLKCLTTHETRADCTPSLIEVTASGTDAELPTYARQGQAVDVRRLQLALLMEQDAATALRFTENCLVVSWLADTMKTEMFLHSSSKFQSSLCTRYLNW